MRKKLGAEFQRRQIARWVQRWRFNQTESAINSSTCTNWPIGKQWIFENWSFLLLHQLSLGLYFSFYIRKWKTRGYHGCLSTGFVERRGWEPGQAALSAMTSVPRDPQREDGFSAKGLHPLIFSFHLTHHLSPFYANKRTIIHRW